MEAGVHRRGTIGGSERNPTRERSLFKTLPTLLRRNADCPELLCHRISRVWLCSYEKVVTRLTKGLRSEKLT
jgi:hypothetical protein